MKKYQIGNATIIVHRPELSQEEVEKRKKQIAQALRQCADIGVRNEKEENT